MEGKGKQEIFPQRVSSYRQCIFALSEAAITSSNQCMWWGIVLVYEIITVWWIGNQSTKEMKMTNEQMNNPNNKKIALYFSQ